VTQESVVKAKALSISSAVALVTAVELGVIKGGPDDLVEQSDTTIKPSIRRTLGTDLSSRPARRNFRFLIQRRSRPSVWSQQRLVIDRLSLLIRWTRELTKRQVCR
jgi:hypothetical protein